MKLRLFIFQFMMIGIFSACQSDRAYINAIPKDSPAVISMDANKLSGVGNKFILKALLHAHNLNDIGLDVTEKMYLFESPNGNLGLCAKINDADQLTSTLEKLHLEISEQRGFHFTTIKDSWVIGYSDVSMLVMGPTTIAAQGELKKQMVKYLKQDEEEGIMSSRIMEKLDTIDAPMAMVAQIKALPDELITPFSLGTPKDADPSQIWLQAEMNIKKHKLILQGHTFSYNKSIDSQLQESAKVYRPIKGRYEKQMSRHDVLGMFMNVQGKEFIKLMQDNKGLQAMLAGINTAIDMDNIIKGFDGDVSIIVPKYDEGAVSIMMNAQIENANWLDDVDYWKQSVPDGGTIIDWEKTPSITSYIYRGGKTSYYFGVDHHMKEYFSGETQESALRSCYSSSNYTAQDYDLLDYPIKGQKMVMIINLGYLGNEKTQAVTSMLSPLFGNLSTIVFEMK